MESVLNSGLRHGSKQEINTRDEYDDTSYLWLSFGTACAYFVHVIMVAIEEPVREWTMEYSRCRQSMRVLLEDPVQLANAIINN